MGIKLLVEALCCLGFDETCVDCKPVGRCGLQA